MMCLGMVFLYLFCLAFMYLLNLWLDVFIHFGKLSPIISSDIASAPLPLPSSSGTVEVPTLQDHQWSWVQNDIHTHRTQQVVI